jgi:hypothetical protein
LQRGARLIVGQRRQTVHSLARAPKEGQGIGFAQTVTLSKHLVQIRVGGPVVSLPDLSADAASDALGTSHENPADVIEIHGQHQGFFEDYTPWKEAR